jgi:predicted RNA-binding protein YlxR (DUF448 family)
MSPHPVLRTCVGCRGIQEQRVLVRLTIDPAGGMLVNSPPAPKAPGRGAYLCPSLLCFGKAWHRKAFARALRRELPGLDEAAVRRNFEAELRRRGAIAG